MHTSNDETKSKRYTFSLASDVDVEELLINNFLEPIFLK